MQNNENIPKGIPWLFISLLSLLTGQQTELFDIPAASFSCLLSPDKIEGESLSHFIVVSFTFTAAPPLQLDIAHTDWLS